MSSLSSSLNQIINFTQSVIQAEVRMQNQQRVILLDHILLTPFAISYASLG